MADPFATKEELAAGWRPLTPAELLIVDSKLADASYWLRIWYPELDTIDDTYGPNMVVREMVKRALLNGDVEGIAQTSENESAGPWAHSNSRSYTNPDGSLFLKKVEIDLLDRITGRNSDGAVSMTAPGL